MVMPVCVLIFTPLPLVVALIVKTITGFLRTRREKAAGKDVVQLDGEAEIHQNADGFQEAKKTIRYAKDAETDGDYEEAEPMIISDSRIHNLRSPVQTDV